jgi:hypothetical protein
LPVKACIACVKPQLADIIYLIGLSGYLGATMVLSLASDFLSLATVHIYVFYLMATRIFSWHLGIIYSLFNIFRG